MIAADFLGVGVNAEAPPLKPNEGGWPATGGVKEAEEANPADLATYLFNQLQSAHLWVMEILEIKPSSSNSLKRANLVLGGISWAGFRKLRS